MVGQPLAGDLNDYKSWEESGTEAAVGSHPRPPTAAVPATRLVRPHRRRKGEGLPDWKKAHNKSHKQVRARTSEHLSFPSSGPISAIGLGLCRWIKGQPVPFS